MRPNKSSAEFPLKSGLLWALRLFAILLVALAAAILFSGGGFDPLRLTSAGKVELAFYSTACVGILAACRWELAGGTLCIAATIAFFAMMFTSAGRFPNGLIFYLLPLAGILFVFDGVRKSRRTVN